MEDNFIWGNRANPVIENMLLPVLGIVAVSFEIIMEDVCVGDEPSIWSDF